jgi:homoprotocatechuate degradation regulator HpaR
MPRKPKRRRPTASEDPLKIPAGRKMRRFEHSLPMALLRAREAVMAYFRPLHRARGVTEQQWRVLRALHDEPESDVTRLAARTCLMLPSLSRILVQLTKRNLVARRTLRTDLRRSMISLTGAGRALVDKGSLRSEEQYAEIARRLGATQLRALYAFLAEIEHKLTHPPLK